MSSDTIIEKICRLPIEFYGGSKSMVELVAEAGINEYPSVLTSENIAKYVRDHPALVDQWLTWSANKRTDSGWYFARQRDEFIVGFYPKGDSLRFEDQTAACVEYIVREVKAIMQIRRRKDCAHSGLGGAMRR